MSDVWFLIYDVWCLVTGVGCLVGGVRCVVSGVGAVVVGGGGRGAGVRVEESANWRLLSAWALSASHGVPLIVNAPTSRESPRPS